VKLKSAKDQAARYVAPIFSAGKPTTILIDVSPTHVLAMCDEKTVVDWRGDARELTVWRGSIPTSPRSLFLDTHQSRYRITKLTYTALQSLAENQ
jgi:hypothetical protein